MGTIDDRLLPVFAAQHWLVSLADVRAAGGSMDSVSWRLRTGRWEAQDSTVYRLVGTPMSWSGRVLAPILGGPTGAVASHTSAAALHGIPVFGRGTPEITIPRGTQHRCTGVIVHTSTDLDLCGPVVIDGIPTTNIGRTILDLSRRSSDKRILRAMEWARRTELVTWSDLIHVLVQHARRGRPGIRRMRRVIAKNMGRDEVTDSDFELFFLALMREAGLPEPVLHYRVMDDGRFVAEVDLGYPHLKIAIELDGAVHLDEDVHELDLPRQNDLVLLGWTVLRFTWRRFRDRPEAVVAEIRAAIRARQLELA